MERIGLFELVPKLYWSLIFRAKHRVCPRLGETRENRRGISHAYFLGRRRLYFVGADAVRDRCTDGWPSSSQR
jgi:hypothetical protein